mgnify:CR=1 FL=1
MSSIIRCTDLNYHYKDGSQQNQIINNLNFEVQAQESIAILGQSGCGKSTLLNLLGGIDQPSGGQVMINNTDLSTLNETQITQIRADNLGFVYQFHHLLKDFSAINNVMMPLLNQGSDIKSAQ